MSAKSRSLSADVGRTSEPLMQQNAPFINRNEEDSDFRGAYDQACSRRSRSQKVGARVERIGMIMVENGGWPFMYLDR